MELINNLPPILNKNQIVIERRVLKILKRRSEQNTMGKLQSLTAGKLYEKDRTRDIKS